MTFQPSMPYLIKLPIAVQNRKFEETIEMVEQKEMPLPS